MPCWRRPTSSSPTCVHTSCPGLLDTRSRPAGRTVPDVGLRRDHRLRVGAPMGSGRLRLRGLRRAGVLSTMMVPGADLPLTPGGSGDHVTAITAVAGIAAALFPGSLRPGPAGVDVPPMVRDLHRRIGREPGAPPGRTLHPGPGPRRPIRSTTPIAAGTVAGSSCSGSSPTGTGSRSWPPWAVPICSRTRGSWTHPAGPSTGAVLIAIMSEVFASADLEQSSGRRRSMPAACGGPRCRVPVTFPTMPKRWPPGRSSRCRWPTGRRPWWPARWTSRRSRGRLPGGCPRPGSTPRRSSLDVGHGLGAHHRTPRTEPWVRGPVSLRGVAAGQPGGIPWARRSGGPSTRGHCSRP